MRTDMHIEEIQKIYCAILTNAMCIKSAEGSVPVLGTTVDLVGSFMNHSCNPTAFVFFEGRQMRVRALRPLRAGEEICQSYADLSSSVFHRQEAIEKDYFFKCACARCQDEVKELEEKAPTDVDWLKKLDNAQRRLLDLANNAINHHNQTGMHMELAELEADSEKIIRGPFPHGTWPDGMPPLASIHRIFARICKNNDDISGALRYSLKASLTLRERVGDIWVHSLFDTIQIISLLVSLPDQYPILRENSLFSKDDCWNVLHGYLGALKRGATHAFGSDSLYTRAIANWYSNAMLSAGQPHPETRRFKVVYGVSQKRLLGWAGIEESRGVDVLS
ncbi:uncharacterized protein N7500_009162 [Penicillium coprophilum]|uniref:uncharacterized protein n=1 Tax=Penicillium coprophilum TaxID=36646 RepID=UPI00238D3819|nr:uncharacterized protein N7500_009162 [Penicillium coprophilum]KAJ5153723.1 hypothetical protein N7500_009162 [Penicillium coprophilum]